MMDSYPPLRRTACLLATAFFLGYSLAPPCVGEDEKAIDFVRPIRIAKLLWNANPANAASTLSKAMETSIERQLLAELSAALEPLQTLTDPIVATADPSDPRLAPSLVTTLLLNRSEPPEMAGRLDTLQSLQDRELVFRVWQAIDAPNAILYFERALGNSHKDPKWSVVLTRRALQGGSLEATNLLLGLWSTLPFEVQIAAVEPLSSSAGCMSALADAVAEGRVNKDLVNANQLRKWLAVDNAALSSKIESVWGKIRETDNAERQALVAKTIMLLQSGVSGSVARGDKVFERVCSQCHQLHGKGYEVGPNISGNGRGNLEQLVSNVLDPSLVIGEAFQAKIVLTTDGEVVAGLVVAENERYLKIKVQGGKVVEFDKAEDIEQVKTSSKSLMPEGLEAQLTEQELIDLFAYLALLKPLGTEDNELIPGTPEHLVTP